MMMCVTIVACHHFRKLTRLNVTTQAEQDGQFNVLDRQSIIWIYVCRLDVCAVTRCHFNSCLPITKALIPPIIDRQQTLNMQTQPLPLPASSQKVCYTYVTMPSHLTNCLGCNYMNAL